jgi:hypothetical protein
LQLIKAEKAQGTYPLMGTSSETCIYIVTGLVFIYFTKINAFNTEIVASNWLESRRARVYTVHCNPNGTATDISSFD